jgi:D-glucosaminate-6-phosphate ammonia-lyase
MTNQPYARFGIPEIVNAVGYATRVGGSCPHEEVLQAMAAANRAYVEIDDVQSAASKLIARSTGAEAGIVTCGAAAGLTLAAAACLAGNAPELMERLPDVSTFERYEIIYPHVGPYDYDHPLRAAGARLVHLDYQGDDALSRIEAAIGPRTAAIGYNWRQVVESPAIRDLAALAHRRHLPLIVDGAMSLPPVSNLRYFVACGADLATYSGGKHIGGPQASGILCGRQDLIRSAWVQMVDMDVRVPTWSLRAWIASGWITRAPRHGIGRSMKAGKEAIIGLMVALERYTARNHDAEYASWAALIAAITEGLQGIPGLHLTRLPVAPNGQPFPVLRLYCDRETLGLGTQDLINRLRELRPKVVLAEDEDERGATIFPMCLDASQAQYVVESIRQVLANRILE